MNGGLNDVTIIISNENWHLCNVGLQLYLIFSSSFFTSLSFFLSLIYLYLSLSLYSSLFSPLQVSTTGSGWYSDSPLLPNSSQPHLQHPGYYGNAHPRGPVTHNLSLMQSEPALHPPQQFDAPPPHLGGVAHPYTPTGSYSNIAMNSPLGPPSHPPTHFSNYLDPMYRHERSKSLGNLRLLPQPQRYVLEITCQLTIALLLFEFQTLYCVVTVNVLIACNYVHSLQACSCSLIQLTIRCLAQLLATLLYMCIN